MQTDTWSEADTARALEFWEEHQRTHDLSDRLGQVAGIDPVSGRVWFGESAKDIVRQMEDAEGQSTPFYAIRVGRDHYVRKGGRRCSGE